MPTLTHALLADYLLGVLREFLRGARIGVSGPELCCIFGPAGRERAFVPDIAFVSTARLPRGDSRAVRHFRIAPDLAIEVLSPDQPMGLFSEKIQFYLLNGVRLVWIVDPIAETVTVLAPGMEPASVRAGDVLDGGAVLPGLRLPVAALFDAMRLEEQG